ncbi:hypothetical protein [Streptomyces telluris]|uniref:Uncharacterized protein n=2 Tax=Streptomyces telluris TaxID=2720021 RepID=A0A9X2RLI1_9ACTN|nr:hypothetical protein [Streptomyces telluris]MCQ8770952.1 hypothetical protein [Streptomyces telluris]
MTTAFAAPAPAVASAVAVADADADFAAITADAHTNTFHPGAFDWSLARTPEELAFLSRLCFEEPGHEEASIAYLTKELAQLAEIERHVAAVMALVLAELQADDSPLNRGDDLHYALSCFAAEETQHANTFYRYVRTLSGHDLKLGDNLFAERFALYQGPQSPWVKLAALCCSAYVGESVITVFERRTELMDPRHARFFTDLLYKHGLDEARHIKVDHLVMNVVIPGFSDADKAAMRELLDATENYNRELAARFSASVIGEFGFDYTAGNVAHEIQMQLTQMFAAHSHGEDGVYRSVDDGLDPRARLLIKEFTDAEAVHA